MRGATSVAGRGCGSNLRAGLGDFDLPPARSFDRLAAYLRSWARRRAAASALSSGGCEAWRGGGALMRCGEAGDAERDPASPDRSMAPDFIVSAMRFLPTSTSLTRTFTTSPAFTTSRGSLTKLVGQLGDVHEAILMHADVDEGAERRDVRHHALELHAGLQVADLVDALLEGGGLELRARIAAGLFQLGEDVGDGRDAERGVGIVGGAQRLQERAVADDRLQRPLGRRRRSSRPPRRPRGARRKHRAGSCRP